MENQEQLNDECQENRKYGSEAEKKKAKRDRHKQNQKMAKQQQKEKQQQVEQTQINQQKPQEKVDIIQSIMAMVNDEEKLLNEYDFQIHFENQKKVEQKIIEINYLIANISDKKWDLFEDEKEKEQNDQSPKQPRSQRVAQAIIDINTKISILDQKLQQTNQYLDDDLMADNKEHLQMIKENFLEHIKGCQEFHDLLENSTF